MENKKLALDKFIEGIIKIKIPINGQTQDELFELYYKCKEIEKNNIIDAYDNGRPNWGNSMCGEEYFEERFLFKNDAK